MFLLHVQLEPIPVHDTIVCATNYTYNFIKIHIINNLQCM